MDLMLDIETLGNSASACILQIGACVFDRDSGDIIDTFKADVDPQSSLDHGLTIDVDTVMWWLKQSDDARASITSEPRGRLNEVLANLTSFVQKYEANPREVNVWCHASFDFPIMQNAYKAVRKDAPWHYRSGRDLRTLTDLSGVNIYTIKLKRKGTFHDALDDCLHQVKQTVACFKALRKSK